MPLPSFGTWGRARECAASVALTQHRTESEPATRGKVIHAFLCDALLEGKEEALAKVPPEYQATCDAIDLDELPVSEPGAWAPEVQIVLNVETEAAVEVGRGDNTKLNFGERKYNETRGILDVVGLTADGEGVVVIDYKSGFKAEPARDSWQMKMGSAAAMRLWKKDYAIAVVLRVREDEPPFKSVARFDAFDVDGFFEDARQVLERVMTVHKLVAANGLTYVKTSAGNWCRTCPALAGCPQQAHLALQLANAPDLEELELQRMLSPERAAIAWERLDVIDNLSKRIRGGLYALAGQTPFTLRNGMVVGPIWKGREKINGEGAFARAKARWGEGSAELALKKVVTKKGLKAGARDFAKPRKLKIGAEYEAMLTELRDAGLIDEKQTLSVEPHEPTPGDAQALQAYLEGTADGTLLQQLEASVAEGAGAGKKGDDDDPF